VAWEVEFSDEFGVRLTAAEQKSARCAAMLLIGGDKTGNNRWYEEYVPIADAIYDRHLRELEQGE
jgi:hypothetical protein